MGSIPFIIGATGARSWPPRSRRVFIGIKPSPPCKDSIAKSENRSPTPSWDLLSKILE
jgi:hypothetical protein